MRKLIVDRHQQIVGSLYPARYSRWSDDKAWSSQEWKADKSMDDRTEQPVVYPQRETRPQQLIIGDDETAWELSLGSRSFLKRVNDQLRKWYCSQGDRSQLHFATVHLRGLRTYQVFALYFYCHSRCSRLSLIPSHGHQQVECLSLRPLHLLHFPSLHHLWLPALPSALHFP